MKYCFDLDGVICTNTDGEYEKAIPIPKMIKTLMELYAKGETIIIYTARGSTTGIDHSTLTEGQLQEWGVKYHELIFGKPEADVFIDDKGMSIEDISRYTS